MVEDGATIAATDVAPNTVHQVWVATNIPMSSKWTLKSTQGTFLGCDKYGEVIATNEARGPQEEWTLYQVDVMPSSDDRILAGPRRGFAFQSMYGGYLALDDPTETQAKRRLRADGQEVTSLSVWDLNVQWKFRHAYRQMHRATKVAPTAQASLLDEERLSRSRQGWNAGTSHHFTKESRRELVQAQREGRLAEAMLDRRAKLKSDKYAKVRPTRPSLHLTYSDIVFSICAAISVTVLLSRSSSSWPTLLWRSFSARCWAMAIAARVANSISRFSRSFSGFQNE